MQSKVEETKASIKAEVGQEQVGGFKYFLCSPLFGEMIQFANIFQTGWNHQPGKFPTILPCVVATALIIIMIVRIIVSCPNI